MNFTSSMQFILSFDMIPAYNFENFILSSENRTAFHTVRQFSNSGHLSLLLIGATGTGKTHLLHAAINAFGADGHGMFMDILKLKGTIQDREGINLQFLSSHASYRLIAIDGLEQIENDFEAQELLLFLYNLVRNNGGQLLFSSQIHPNHQPGIRDELKSRLLWGDVVAINSPGDETLEKVMNKIAMDRNILFPEELIHFLVLRLPRSVPEYVRVVELLDHKSLHQARSINIPFAKEVLSL